MGYFLTIFSFSDCFYFPLYYVANLEFKIELEVFSKKCEFSLIKFWDSESLAGF